MNDHQTKRQETLWLTAAMIMPILHSASRSSWLAALLAAGGTISVCGITGRYTTETGSVLEIVRNLWKGILIAEILKWSTAYWPGTDNRWTIALILLVLSGWLTLGGSTRSACAGCVLFWPIILMTVVIVISGCLEADFSRITLQWQMREAWIVPIFLIPFMGRGQGKGYHLGKSIAYLIAGITVSAATAGVLSYPVMRVMEAPIYELSRSIELFGTIERFESIAAMAMTIGAFVSVSYLLNTVKTKTEKELYAYIGYIGILCISNVPVDSRIVAISGMVIWIGIPLIMEIGKNLKILKNRG